jgi:hypothetical protein
MSDATASDDTSDPTGTPHLGTDSDPLSAGTAVPADSDPVSTIPMQADGGRPEGDPAALTSDGPVATDVAEGSPSTVAPPTQNSDHPQS